MSGPGSLGRNISSNYAGQVYVALIGIAMVPLYLKYMGLEAYGLIGFFAMAQAWIQVLDFGLSPTLGREAAKLSAGSTNAGTLKLFLRLVEILFGILGLVVVLLSWVLGSWVAESWLKVGTLDAAEVAGCVVVVGVVASLRLASGVYRGGLLGLEQQVGANAIAVAVATLRFVAVVPVLIWVSNSILAFFAFQLAVAVVELVLFRIALMRRIPPGPVPRLDWHALEKPLRFGRGLAFLTCTWIAITQADKLILSHLLPLERYGAFTLATTIALGTILLVSPLQQAVLPRLIVLAEQGQHGALIELYRRTTICLAAVLAGVGAVMAAFPRQVLYVWTGDVEAAAEAAELLRWYAVGTCLMGVAGMSYLLQHAMGDLRLHIKGNLVCLLVLIPAVILGTFRYGAIGAAVTWAATNLLFLLFWTPIVHGKFVPEIRTAWLVRDVAPAFLIAAAAVLISGLVSWPLESRAASLLGLVTMAVVLVVATLLVYPDTRPMVAGWMRRAGSRA
ncbi:MAG TPA: oligosaccharide flippase family protein [Burkholderiales bacterium]|nr:oligosaccharide flippase family protein [Burkholderiales bacterium]